MPEEIVEKELGSEIKTAYLDYSMSVIMQRAIPDIRDGLKPVQRRILYTMYEMGLRPNQPHKKSARVVGETLGKYHPHGDQAVYEALTRMAQDFSMRYTLVQGQGNFGSIDGDPPAAMRYTEARLNPVAMELLEELASETVSYRPNYDGSLMEPEVLPSRIPNLLMNGASGIAVGMSTNIPPHNLAELIDALVLLIEKPLATVEDIMKVLKGPDFPTGGVILGKKEIKNYFETGRGLLKLRGVAQIEEFKNGKSAIIISEIPYFVKKSELLKHIAELVQNRKLDGISDIRDESSKDGMRIVVELKRDANPNVILNNLYKHTQLETTFAVNMVAIEATRPRTLNIIEALKSFIDFRKEITKRKLLYELKEARARLHILEGLKVVVKNIDEIVELIKKSEDINSARKRLMDRFALTHIQADAILNMRLHQLTKLERTKIEDEYAVTKKRIDEINELLASEKKILEVVKKDMLQIKNKYADDRKTRIVRDTGEIDIEDLIEKEDVIVTVSYAGYIKRIPLDVYKTQNRGGKGVIAAELKDEDFIEEVIVSDTHAYMLIFTNLGRVYSLRVFDIPEASRLSRGKAIVNLLPLKPGERPNAFLAVSDFEDDAYVFFVTRNGFVKKTKLKFFESIRTTGIVACKLAEGDVIISTLKVKTKDQIFIATKNGFAIRFSSDGVRDMGRTARGVRGIKLGKDDQAIGAEVVDGNSTIFVATKNGFGKRTEISEYRLQNRGGKGVINLKVTEKTGEVVGIKKIKADEELILVSQNGKIIRIPAETVRNIGRNTQGVRIMRMEEGDSVKALEVAKK